MVEVKEEVEEVKEEVIEEEVLEGLKENVILWVLRMAAQEPIAHLIIHLALNGLALLQISSSNKHTHHNLCLMQIQRHKVRVSLSNVNSLVDLLVVLRQTVLVIILQALNGLDLDNNLKCSSKQRQTFKHMVSKDNQQTKWAKQVKASNHVDMATIAIKIRRTNVILAMIKSMPVNHL